MYNFHDYYINQPNYNKLKELSLLINNNNDYKIIAQFIIKNKIDINSYLNVSKYMYAPLYYVVLHTPNIKLFKWLIKNNVDLNLKLDINLEEYNRLKEIKDKSPINLNINLYLPPNILFTCNSIYIKLLQKINNKNKFLNDFNITDIEYLLKTANINRLYELNINIDNYINNNNIFEFIIIDELIDKLKFICIFKNDKKNIDETISKYLNVFKLLKSNEKNNINLIQYAVDWYLVEIYKFLIINTTCDLNKIKLVYHKNLNDIQTATFRQLFNDYNYVLLGGELI